MSSILPTEADAGFKDAASYDSYRPSYLPETVNYLLKSLKIKDFKNAKVLDLAAGTGKFTELLAAQQEAYEIVAVEPHNEMRAELARKGLKNVVVKDGHSTKIPLPDEWADAVMIAQAFHWFANVESLKEIARVLKPGGFVGMVWNIEDYNQPLGWQASTAWEEKMKQNTWSLVDHHTRFRDEKWRLAFEEQQQQLEGGPIFSTPLAEKSFEFTKWLTPEQIWSRYATLSQVLVLDPEKKQATKEFIASIIEQDTQAPKRDKGEVELHGKTATYWTQKL